MANINMDSIAFYTPPKSKASTSKPRSSVVLSSLAESSNLIQSELFSQVCPQMLEESESSLAEISREFDQPILSLLEQSPQITNTPQISNLSGPGTVAQSSNEESNQLSPVFESETLLPYFLERQTDDVAAFQDESGSPANCHTTNSSVSLHGSLEHSSVTSYHSDDCTEKSEEDSIIDPVLRSRENRQKRLLDLCQKRIPLLSSEQVSQTRRGSSKKQRKQRKSNEQRRSDPRASTQPHNSETGQIREAPLSGSVNYRRVGSTMNFTINFSIEDGQFPDALLPFSRPLRQFNSKPKKKLRFTAAEDFRLVKLKERGLSWASIASSFPGRSTGSLQVRYSTKLKHNY